MKLKKRGKDAYEVEVPTFRPDVEREIDLVEEIARRRGYDSFPATLPPASAPAERPSAMRRLEGLARDAMAAAGFHEAINYSFVGRAGLERLGWGGDEVVALRNPLSAEMDVMRTTLLAGLLGNAALNLNRGQDAVAMFEVGRVFAKDGEGPLPREGMRLAAILTGGAPASLWPAGPAPGGALSRRPLLPTPLPWWFISEEDRR